MLCSTNSIRSQHGYASQEKRNTVWLDNCARCLDNAAVHAAKALRNTVLLVSRILEKVMLEPPATDQIISTGKGGQPVRGKIKAGTKKASFRICQKDLS